MVLPINPAHDGIENPRIDPEVEHRYVGCKFKNDADGYLKQGECGTGDDEMTDKELKPWAFNAKKWRIENGYDTPEWEMYVKNVICTVTIFSIISFVLGVIMGEMII